ncbi:TcpQ domain-containing protein [Colwellia sp. MB3u-70]|uniref:TcpQ domain-containing protein n=1 Tax=unclassified Colwellia TaxID=196834 RepID=UPI0015F5D626|nr:MULTISPECIES: TcpQ domain-containing protein [unclassified Colwellia]MBA6292685.1 TcpQ domain-containing protein [Colwellia sp. MB3u-8]MBA6307480.1 TcpQ domain-containing protein [Colwellia sp. MB3u-70]
MKFWLPSIILGLILIGLASALLLDTGPLFSTSQEPADKVVATKVDTYPAEQAESLAQEETLDAEKSTNAAADGLSNYYASIRGDMTGTGPQIRNNIVYLPEPKGDLEKILTARALITRPLPKNWIGETDNHPFRLGETLFGKLSQYAGDNNLQVIWWLNRDFVVKNSFRINKDIVTTSYQVGKAIQGHFENGLSIYFCYQQRTIVVIEHDTAYLEKECLLLPNRRH